MQVFQIIHPLLHPSFISIIYRYTYVSFLCYIVHVTANNHSFIFQHMTVIYFYYKGDLL